VRSVQNSNTCWTPLDTLSRLPKGHNGFLALGKRRNDLGYSMKMTPKFLRVTLGATVGAVLWAGCASNRPGNATSGGKAIVLDSQEDLTRPHIDTHPEWRLGVNMSFPNPPYAYPRPSDLGTAVGQPEI
jgi:hypothetical protein